MKPEDVPELALYPSIRAFVGLESVDLWIGTGGLAIAQLVLPVVNAWAYLPVHWDGLWGAFEAGVPQPYSDPLLEAFLVKSGVRLIKPAQYMDKWRLDIQGVQPVPNDAVKQALGFGKSAVPPSKD